MSMHLAHKDRRKCFTKHAPVHHLAWSDRRPPVGGPGLDPPLLQMPAQSAVRGTPLRLCSSTSTASVICKSSRQSCPRSVNYHHHQTRPQTSTHEHTPKTHLVLTGRILPCSRPCLWRCAPGQHAVRVGRQVWVGLGYTQLYLCVFKWSWSSCVRRRSCNRMSVPQITWRMPE